MMMRRLFPILYLFSVRARASFLFQAVPHHCRHHHHAAAATCSARASRTGGAAGKDVGGGGAIACFSISRHSSSSSSRRRAGRQQQQTRIQRQRRRRRIISLLSILNDDDDTDDASDTATTASKNRATSTVTTKTPPTATTRRSPPPHHINQRRRDVLTAATSSLLLFGTAAATTTRQPANAAIPFFLNKPKPESSDLYVLTPAKNMTESLQNTPVKVEPDILSSELCLLKTLPVKNKVFRQIESNITYVSSLIPVLEGGGTGPDLWNDACRLIQRVIDDLDKKRGQLQPVFNPEDTSLMQINKGERGEQLVETLRDRLVQLTGALRSNNATKVSYFERKALLALGEVGELLVDAFPYKVPTDGKFSYLPRLLGRAKVTLSFRRGLKMLGNVTIMADGYTAPITAGNFVDLSIRNFYTGLPIRFTKKKLPDTTTTNPASLSSSDFEVANIPILGSFQEGFFDPLTAKPRRLPLEIIRVEKGSGVPKLSYAQGAPESLGYITSFVQQRTTSIEPTDSSKPLLSFNIPGLVAMNHPEKSTNGASSEFFGLQRDSFMNGDEASKRALFDGEYAPFGYIIDGYELFQELQPNDVIESTVVDEWGQLNVVKLRQSSFDEVVKGSEQKEKDTKDKNTTETTKQNTTQTKK